MSRELSLSQLTAELTDFLGLPGTLGLPPVHSVECRRTVATGWSVEAQLDAPTDAERYEAISAWAAFAGGSVQVGGLHASSTRSSGMGRALDADLVVAGLPIKLWVWVDALFAVPLPDAVTA